MEKSKGSLKSLGAMLFDALDKGDATRLERALSAGADKEWTRQGWTPLRTAAARGDEAGLRFLIKAGADLESANGLGNNALLLAAMHGHGPCVRELIAAGADIEAKTVREGWTPAMFAAILANEDCLRTLIDAGANISAKGLNGKNAACYAVDAGHPEMAALVESHAATAKEALAISRAVDKRKRKPKAAGPAAPRRI